MSTILFLNYFAFIGFTITESAIITSPSNVGPKCAGQNVTLRWEYDNPTDLRIATWTFSNDSINRVIIMQKIASAYPAAPTPPPLSVQFVENGTINLFDTSSINTGIYRFAILYGVEPEASNEVDIVIHDAPQALTFQEVTTNTFSCSGSSSIPTVIQVTSKDIVSQKTSPYTRSDTSERIECCYNGTAANCSTERFDVYGTLYCKLVKEADPAPCSPWCSCNVLECIPAIGIPLLILIGCIAGAIFYCWHKEKCCFDKPPTWPCSSRNKSDGSDETENRPLSTTVETTNETSPETKSLQSTKHDGSQVNNQVVQTEGSSPSPIKKGHSKVGPDDNQRSGDPEKNTAGSIREVNNESINTPRPLPILPKIGSKESSQAPNMGDVEANKPKKKKKKKKGKETKEDQIV